jgi:hypothetical protein
MRFSLSWLFVAILLVAVSMVALLNANLLWAAVARTTLVLFLAFAILGGINNAGRIRAFWFGITIVGWVYLAGTIVNYYWFGGDVLNKQLSELLWTAVGNQAIEPEQVRMPSRVLEDGRVVSRYFEYVPLQASFYIVTESIVNIFWALVGGYVAMWFYSRRDASK